MDAELLKTTEGWLRLAETRLGVDSNFAGEYPPKFQEYLSPNEFELALYELAEAAKLSPQSHQFWDAMCQAATNMSLDELHSAFAARWAALRRT